MIEEPISSTIAPAVTRQAVPVIELRDLTRTYGSGQAAVQALRGVDLRIDDGDFVAVMGPSGSGKSTCMNIIGCLDTPTSGSYLFEGFQVGHLTRQQRALLRRYHLGFVFQGYNLLNRTSALENVELPLLYRGVPQREQRLDARVLKYPPRHQRVPHRPHRILVASPPAHHLQVLHQLRVGEMITHQVETLQIAARFHIAPGKQARFDGRHGVLLREIVSATI